MYGISLLGKEWISVLSLLSKDKPWSQKIKAEKPVRERRVIGQLTQSENSESVHLRDKRTPFLHFSSLSRSISGYILIVASIPISRRANSISTYD